jgi:hypothetical protein
MGRLARRFGQGHGDDTSSRGADRPYPTKRVDGWWHDTRVFGTKAQHSVFCCVVVVPVVVSVRWAVVVEQSVRFSITTFF